jgi:hypothetical protein
MMRKLESDDSDAETKQMREVRASELIVHPVSSAQCFAFAISASLLYGIQRGLSLDIDRDSGFLLTPSLCYVQIEKIYVEDMAKLDKMRKVTDFHCLSLRLRLVIFLDLLLGCPCCTFCL